MLEDKILLFLETARRQSLNRAADAMGIEQDEAEEMIRALERRLNLKLFSEFQGKKRLTRLGEKFYHGCNRLEEMANELLEEMDYTPVPQIQIGFTGTWDNQGIIDLVSQYKSQNSQVTFTFRKEDIPGLKNALVGGDVDIVFGLRSAFDEDPELKMVDLFEYPLCLIVPKDHPFEKKKKIAVEDLQNENIVVLDRRQAVTFFVDPLVACGLKRGGAAWQSKARSLDDLIKTVRLANGVGLAVKENLDHDRLKDEKFTLIDLKFPYAAIVRDPEERPEIINFVEAAVEYFLPEAAKERAKKAEKRAKKGGKSSE